MCINKGDWTPISGHKNYGNNPKFGEIVTVKSMCTVYPGNYNLVGYEIDFDGGLQSYRPIHFIPLSDKDETEILAERQSQFQFHHN